MEIVLRTPRFLDSSMLPVAVGLGGLAATAALLYWAERERRAKRRRARRRVPAPKPGAGEPFAPRRGRREEADESEVGGEIRSREEEQDRADEERGDVPFPTDEPLGR